MDFQRVMIFFFQKESKFPSFLIRDFHSRGAMHVMGLVYVSHILKLLNSVKPGWRKVFCCKVSWTFEIQHPKYSELMLFPTIKPRKEVESRPFASWLRKGNGPDFIIWFRVKHVAKLEYFDGFNLQTFMIMFFFVEGFEKSPIFRFRGRLWTLRDFALQHSNWDSFTDKGKLRVWLPDLTKTPSEHDSWVIKNKLSYWKNLGGLYHCYLLTFPWHGFHMFHFWFTALQWHGDWENPGIKLKRAKKKGEWSLASVEILLKFELIWPKYI